MGTPTEDDVASRAANMAGNKAVDGGKNKGGIDCFALVDKVLKSAGAKTAADFGEVTGDADYVWGDEIDLSEVQPGDILQFRNHTVKTTTLELRETNWKTTLEEGPAVRPHHTAVVVEVLNDGSVKVVEQHVKPNPKRISKNPIARLAEGDETRYLGSGKKIIIKVTGTVKAYRPVPKPKGATLFPGNEKTKSRAATLFPRHEKPTVSVRQVIAHYRPSEGGPRRFPSPLRGVLHRDTHTRDRLI